MSRGMLPWGLRFGNGSNADRANVQYDGKARAIPDDATSTYPRLRDTGKKPSDSARLYSGQMLEGDGTDDHVDIGDIGASCKSLEITIDPTTTTEGVIQLASGVSVSISSGTISTAGLSNVTAYVNGVTGTTVAAELTVLALTFDAVSCSDVQLFFNGSDYFAGMQGNVKLWTETLDSDDVTFSYANPEQPAFNRPGTSLTEAGLAEWWPLVAGSGDTCYSWSDNGNHGILTNFDTTTCWDAGKSLSSPRVLQTAYIPFNLDTGVLRPIGTSGGVDFTREHNELNWNGQSWVNCGNGFDVNPSSALIIEMVARFPKVSATNYTIYKNSSYRSYITNVSTLGFYVHVDGSFRSVSMQRPFWGGLFNNSPSLSEIVHVILVYNSASKKLQIIAGGVESVSNVLSELNSYTIDADTTSLKLNYSKGKFQLISTAIWSDADAQKIINSGLDEWAFKRAKKVIPGNYKIGVGTGDSFANDNDDWPGQLRSYCNCSIKSKGYAGSRLSGDITTNFVLNITERKYDFVVIQGGINDVVADCSVESIKASMLWLITTAKEHGLKVICVNLSPWSANTNWTEERQVVTESYNSWLDGYCSANNISLADIYIALGDETALHTDYDSGDHLHPNEAGSLKIAETIKAAMEAE